MSATIRAYNIVQRWHMLPDFLRLRQELGQREVEFLRQRLEEHLGPLKPIHARGFTLHEGSRDDTELYNEELAETNRVPFVEARTEDSLALSEIPSLTLHSVLNRLDAIAQDLARQASAHFYQTLGSVLDSKGQTVPVPAGKFNSDVLLDALDKILLDFRPDGSPIMHEFHIPPGAEPRFRQAIRELETRTDLKQRFDTMIERKRTEWNAREADRKLVG